jgi:hypothetical protein
LSEHENEERPTEFTMMVPPELEGGVYANVLSTWHSAYEFTLDFSASQPPQVPDDPTSPIVIPCRVVSRVKIPVTLVFDVLRALNDAMTAYEAQFGEIRRPEPQDEGE